MRTCANRELANPVDDRHRYDFLTHYAKLLALRTDCSRTAVRDSLRHVLPKGLRAIRYYGFYHPAAKKNRERIKMHTGTPIFIGPPPAAQETPLPACSRCEKPMRLVERIARCPMSRAPPGIPVLRFS